MYLKKKNPDELFQTLKDDAVKVLQSICQKIWKIQQWPQDWKRLVFVPITKGKVKECSNYPIIAMEETWVQSLGWEDPLEKGKATHSSILAWRIPWSVQSMGHKELDMTERLPLTTVYKFDKQGFTV